jgi:heptaprenyl diphosphate synthase
VCFALKTKKIALLGLLSAIALTIFMVEAQIPPVVPLPGVKLGLANIVTVFAVFAMGPKEGAAVLFVRIFLGAVFAGNFSTIFYSAAGGACAILVTILMRKILKENQMWVAGCVGAVAHSVGQMTMAIALTGTPSLAVYLPVMIAISIVTGLFTGLCAQFLVNRRGNLWKTILK